MRGIGSQRAPLVVLPYPRPGARQRIPAGRCTPIAIGLGSALDNRRDQPREAAPCIVLAGQPQFVEECPVPLSCSVDQPVEAHDFDVCLGGVVETEVPETVMCRP